MTTIQTFNSGESGEVIRNKLNTSLTNLNNDKAENSTVESLETSLEAQINTKVTNIYGGSNVSVNRVGNDVYVSATGGGGGSGNDGAFAYYSTTATQGQIVINLSYTYENGNNNLFVFVNGIKMQVGNDYEETSNTSITFNYGLNIGDIIQVIYPNKGLNWKNIYDNLTSYIKDDAVSYNGSSYICIADTTGNLPTNTTYWNVLAQKGDQGPQGIQGEKGEQGEQGIQGIQGLKGDKGDKGDTGDQGIQGIQGLKGDKGDKGDAGTNGIDGIDGTDGRGIVSITLTSGDHSPGTLDTYTITYTDATTSTFQVYNGADGTGTLPTSGGLTYSAINSSQAITNGNYYGVTCTGDITLTLADGTSSGQNLSIKKLDNTSYTITITGNIEGETSIVMDTQYESLDLFWNGTYYLIK